MEALEQEEQEQEQEPEQEQEQEQEEDETEDDEGAKGLVKLQAVGRGRLARRRSQPEAAALVGPEESRRWSELGFAHAQRLVQGTAQGAAGDDDDDDISKAGTYQ